MLRMTTRLIVRRYLVSLRNIGEKEPGHVSVQGLDERGRKRTFLRVPFDQLEMTRSRCRVRLEPPISQKMTATLGRRERAPKPMAADAGTRTIRVGHSPDSDDAFMFYALTHGKLDTGGLTFVHQLQDIETLNDPAPPR